MPAADRTQLLKLKYTDRLNRPEWKDLSARLKKERGKKCQICGSGWRLELHHGYYKHSTLPWEYEESSLWVLCKICHNEKHRDWDALNRIIGHIHPKDYGLIQKSIGEAVSEFEFGPHREAILEILSEERERSGSRYSQYVASLISSSSEGNSNASTVAEKIESEFPGIIVEVIDDDTGPDCAVVISGPDPETEKAIQEWCDTNRE